jgi:hypothetical protein
VKILENVLHSVLHKMKNLLKIKRLSGPDGTRTRDLRRDRAAF